MRTYGVDECGEFLKVDRTTVLKLAGDGILPGAKIGRSWVFLEDELIEYVRKQTYSQMRARRAEREIDDSLAASSGRHMSDAPTRQSRRKIKVPNLPEVAGEITRPQVSVS